MKSLSISETRKNLPTIVREVGQNGQIVTITVNSDPEAVLLGYQEFMSILETAKLSLGDIGQVLSHAIVQVPQQTDTEVRGEPVPGHLQTDAPAVAPNGEGEENQEAQNESAHEEEHNEGY